ncbi:trypsin-like serine protease, partial [Xanthomonas sp. GPE 39]|uniref:trypsin-like serine protease n=1 Tax=Xanthomonas sp. GPE 39 TaxID=1583099 RepID=UPI00126988AF
SDRSVLASSAYDSRESLKFITRSSYEKPWLVVGNISGCTATWLGNSGDWSYILTAAHCVPYTAEETAVNKTFKDLNGNIIASGSGIAYVPPQRISVPRGMGGASTDVAVIKLPVVGQILDANERPVERPILNDYLDEVGRDVIFVGYGSWGVGTESNGGYWPEKGARRLYSRSRISEVFENDYGIDAQYDPQGPSAYWARTAPGDSGSAWWQIRNGKPVIIATTNGGSATKSTGARISKYADWIKSIYPEARFLSEEPPPGCIVDIETSEKFCMHPGEAKAYSLPAWIYNKKVYVDAAPGTAVVLSDWDNLPYARKARFVGTVENSDLRNVEADNGSYLDFSKPKSMMVVSDTTPLGCIVSLTSSEKYCLPAGKRSHYSLPDWIYHSQVYVDAAPGTAVVLSDWDNLSYNRIANFSGVTQNWELKSVKASDSNYLDFSQPRSMRVIQYLENSSE